jgi:hypothetical protein
MKFKRAIKKLSSWRTPESRREPIALVLMLLLVTGCVSLGESKSAIEWTEDVKLSDGTVVQLKRKTALTKSGFPTQRRGLDKSHYYCYEPLQMWWKTYGGFEADIFDIVDGKAYLHLPITGCFTCQKNNYPETDALYFVWYEDHWQKIAHEEFPEQSAWNLLMYITGVTPKQDASGHLTIKQKRVRDRSLIFDQKRDQWKRISDHRLYTGSCKACRDVRNRYYGNNKNFPEIFIAQGNGPCSGKVAINK